MSIIHKLLMESTQISQKTEMPALGKRFVVLFAILLLCIFDVFTIDYILR